MNNGWVSGWTGEERNTSSSERHILVELLLFPKYGYGGVNGSFKCVWFGAGSEVFEMIP
jgi:hypothetical protein